jgi:hypothetical protein
VSRYAIGIDLGTTHSALSYLSLEEGAARGAAQSVLPIAQLTAPGTLEERLLLPSFVYLPNASEFPPGSLGLPWAKERHEVVGELARTHGAKVPHRLVASSKSWLCHPGIDRRGAILPWQAPDDVQRISPLDAAVRVLSHLREAWDHKLEGGDRALAKQDVVLTVPASFDAAARELTLEAAARAGFPSVTLLEEPQAALYAWLEAAGDGFRKQVKPGDVGGGTTDFSLIAVTDRGGSLELNRVAVGDHILLGGDNMDLALAHTLAQRFAAEGKKLDAWQLNGLTHACRVAKEQLFADSKLEKAPIAVASRGSSLMGGTLRTELTRSELTALLVDGFFPVVEASAEPRTARRTGLAQLALPYAQDAGVTRHLASFLSRQARALAGSPDSPVKSEGRAFIHPTAVLFNGGVFKAEPLKSRVLEVLDGWLKADAGAPAKELEGADLDLSVARGAAYYGWVRQGHGLRIRGGTARAYYVGVETAMPAVPGMDPPVKALCVAPFGMEEGTQAFGLVVGEPTRFRFFASSTRRDDRVGTLLEEVDALEEVAPIETSLGASSVAEARDAGRLVPVNLQAAVTEMGQLELRCLEKGGEGQWKLELNVRSS